MEDSDFPINHSDCNLINPFLSRNNQNNSYEVRQYFSGDPQENNSDACSNPSGRYFPGDTHVNHNGMFGNPK